MGSVVFCNTKINGGGEQSAQYIADMLGGALVSLTTDEWKFVAASTQVWYMNDSVYKLLNDENIVYFKNVIRSGEKVVIVLNFTIGGMQNQAWLSEHVSKFMFLNNEKSDEFHEKCCDELKPIPKIVLPPPVDIKKYLSINRNYYRKPITIGRHSRISLKYPNEPEHMYKKLAEKLPNVKFKFQMAHKRIKETFKDDDRFIFNDWDEEPIPEFLESIDIYLSIINPNTKEQGSRTLMEAMASGLPCVVENRDGMGERMINGYTGRLVKDEDEAIKATIELCNNLLLREKYGRGARKIAERFIPEKWIKAIKQ